MAFTFANMTPFDDPADRTALAKAVAQLEAPSFTIKVANLVGTPVEWAMERLPGSAAEKVQKVIRSALDKAVHGALRTMDESTRGAPARPRTHTAMVAASGAMGGFFGLKGTLVELPITTTIIMRSVADIARSEGFLISSPIVQGDCVQVFALGGRSSDDDAAESAYYAARVGLSELARETGRVLVEGAAHQTASVASQGFQFTPGQAAAWLAQIIEAVAQRFGVKVTEKLALQAAPILGAASGAAINALFMSHYQHMAQGHFVVRRLEEKYGEQVVRGAYRILQADAGIELE